MGIDEHSVQLLARWKAGDEAAANEIFSRYVHRLSGLARNRMSEKIRRRVDPEDVVQSVYRSFFRQAKEERYEIKRSGDLWRLLAAITINKTMHQIEHHRAAKRSVDGEAAMPADSSCFLLSPLAIAHEPTAEEAVILIDEIEAFMKSLLPHERQVLELRLQDQSSEAIADKIQRSTRTVRRTIERLKTLLAERFNQSSDL